MRAAFVLIGAVLAGCASYSAEEINAAISRGDCAGVESKMQARAQGGDATAMNNLGVVAENCRRDTKSAIGYYSLSARMGNDTARMNLTRLGQPVPAPDLVRQSSSGNPALGLMLLQAAQPKPLPAPATPLNCTTRVVGGVARTTCW